MSQPSCWGTLSWVCSDPLGAAAGELSNSINLTHQHNTITKMNKVALLNKATKPKSTD